MALSTNWQYEKIGIGKNNLALISLASWFFVISLENVYISKNALMNLKWIYSIDGS